MRVVAGPFRAELELSAAAPPGTDPRARLVVPNRAAAGEEEGDRRPVRRTPAKVSVLRFDRDDRVELSFDDDPPSSSREAAADGSNGESETDVPTSSSVARRGDDRRSFAGAETAAKRETPKNANPPFRTTQCRAAAVDGAGSVSWETGGTRRRTEEEKPRPPPPVFLLVVQKRDGIVVARPASAPKLGSEPSKPRAGARSLDPIRRLEGEANDVGQTDPKEVKRTISRGRMDRVIGVYQIFDPDDVSSCEIGKRPLALGRSSVDGRSIVWQAKTTEECREISRGKERFGTGGPTVFVYDCRHERREGSMRRTMGKGEVTSLATGLCHGMENRNSFLQSLNFGSGIELDLFVRSLGAASQTAQCSRYNGMVAAEKEVVDPVSLDTRNATVEVPNTRNALGAVLQKQKAETTNRSLEKCTSSKTKVRRKRSSLVVVARRVSTGSGAVAYTALDRKRNGERKKKRRRGVDIKEKDALERIGSSCRGAANLSSEPATQTEHIKSSMSLGLNAEIAQCQPQSLPEITSSSNQSFYFVTPEERHTLTDYVFLLTSQLKRGTLTERDLGKANRRKNVEFQVGYLGMRCRHCGGNERGAYFPSTAKNLQACPPMIHTHMMKCAHCPHAVRKALVTAKNRHRLQVVNWKGETQVSFYARLWRRIHDRSYDGGGRENTHAVAESVHSLVYGSSSLSQKPGNKVFSNSDNGTESESNNETKRAAMNEVPSLVEVSNSCKEEEQSEAAKAVEQLGPPSEEFDLEDALGVIVDIFEEETSSRPGDFEGCPMPVLSDLPIPSLDPTRVSNLAVNDTERHKILNEHPMASVVSNSTLSENSDGRNAFENTSRHAKKKILAEKQYQAQSFQAADADEKEAISGKHVACADSEWDCPEDAYDDNRSVSPASDDLLFSKETCFEVPCAQPSSIVSLNSRSTSRNIFTNEDDALLVKGILKHGRKWEEIWDDGDRLKHIKQSQLKDRARSRWFQQLLERAQVDDTILEDPIALDEFRKSDIMEEHDADFCYSSHVLNEDCSMTIDTPSNELIDNTFLQYPSPPLEIIEGFRLTGSGTDE